MQLNSALVVQLKLIIIFVVEQIENPYKLAYCWQLSFGSDIFSAVFACPVLKVSSCLAR